MKRTNKPIQRMPDAANCSISEDFTIISNNLIRNPNMSAKAKTILFILLSNKKGWKSYKEAIQQMMKEGKCAIEAGIQELEQLGYLKRIKYRDKSTKQIQGSFWAYTNQPGKFDYSMNLYELQKLNLEICLINSAMEPYPDFQVMEISCKEYIKKNIKRKKIQKKDFLVIMLTQLQQTNNHTTNQLQKLTPILVEFINHRKQIKRPLTELACKRITTKLKPHPIQTIMDALNESIEKGWTGVFPEKQNQTNPIPKYQGLPLPPKTKPKWLTKYEDLLQEAHHLPPNENNTRTNMVHHLHETLMREQTQLMQKNHAIPDAGMIIGYYITWLTNEKWIDQITATAFIYTGKLFRKYLNILSQEHGVNVITGKYYAG